MPLFRGNAFELEIFGKSHSKEIGVVISGIPEGIHIDKKYVESEMKKRAPGNNPYSTKRREDDVPIFTSGFSGDVTNGDEIKITIENTNIISKNYDNINFSPRPSHADYPAFIKYGKIDSGGGAFSGRMTAPLVAAGAIFRQLLERQNINICAHIQSISSCSDSVFNSLSLSDEIFDDIRKKDFPVIDYNAGSLMKKIILEAGKDGDSVGGVIECAAIGVPVGLGDIMFDSLESSISKIMFAIPAVKGIEFGVGFDGTLLNGSEINDEYEYFGDKVRMIKNNNGGILGGLASGAPIVFRVAIKPTPSISLPQKTVNLKTKENTIIKIEGRHDPCIVPRANICIESGLAIALYDYILAEDKKV